MIGHWFKKHRLIAFFLYLLFVSVFILSALEIFFRFYVNYNPSYYTGFKDPRKGEKHFPYGVIKINSDGFFDDEFLPTKQKSRIAYIGDSVLFGVGAGHGHRITELLENELPQYEHMNFAGVGAGISAKSIRRVLDIAKKYRADRVVYVMNLNDIDPDWTVVEKNSAAGTDEKRGIHLRKIEKLLHLRWLRGKSYLYTITRFILKKFLITHGFDIHGFPAYELFPQKHEKILRDSAARIVTLSKLLKDNGIGFLVVILPYEMQISAAAEKKYSDLGVKWEEDSFIDRGTQKIIIEILNKYGIPHIDAYYGFVEAGREESSRRQNKLGEFFVYDRGDTVDWNHPNRKGHRKIADYILKNKELFLQQIAD